MWGPVRYETSGGHDFYDEKKRLSIFFWKKPFQRIDINVDVNAHRYALTHLQRRSRFGFLLMWPFCFHYWFHFRYQMICRVMGHVEPHRVPNSEVCLYGRAGARWEAGRALYIWPSWFGPGLHWD